MMHEPDPLPLLPPPSAACSGINRRRGRVLGVGCDEGVDCSGEGLTGGEEDAGVEDP
jgi:hypothetical protein